MLSQLEFLFTETFISLRRHPMMAFAATTCIAATLFIAGLMALSFLNARYLVDTLMDKVRFVVYFKTDVSRDDTRALFQRIKNLPGVDAEGTTFKSKEMAWAEEQAKDPDTAISLNNKNPLPDCVHVKVHDTQSIPMLKREIESWRTEVSIVRDSADVSTVLEKSRRVIEKGGSVIGIILLLLSLVIVHHTIELTLYARRKEVHIMSLVGATPLTVAMPFLFEGIVYGLFGGGVAFFCLLLFYRSASLTMLEKFSATLYQTPELLTHGVIAVLALGMILGLIGSMVSVIKYLRSPRSRLTNA